MNIRLALKKERLLRALTGMSVKDFEALLPYFIEAYEASERLRKPSRSRAVGGGRRGRLQDIEEKLFFILFYLKAYPTFDVAGFVFGVSRGRTHDWVKRYLPVLESALGRSCALPKRKIRSLEEFESAFPGVSEVLIDVTERPIQRPSTPKTQRKHYSGKKKQHTRKNTVISTPDKRVLYVSPSKPGKTHDKRMFDKEGISHVIPDTVLKWGDLGYQGIQKQMSNVLIPLKKPKGKPLTESQKDENRQIAACRIVVEHAIGGIKRFNCVSQRLRNRLGIDDTFVVVCAGLWNWHLQLQA